MLFFLAWAGLAIDVMGLDVRRPFIWGKNCFAMFFLAKRIKEEKWKGGEKMDEELLRNILFWLRG